MPRTVATRALPQASVALAALLLGFVVPPAADAATTATFTVPRGVVVTDLASAGVTAASLAQSLVGTNIGVTVSNATAIGENFQVGSVSVVDRAVVGFNSGVVLSSGRAGSVVGPNTSENTTALAGGNQDPDANAVVRARAPYLQSSDAASLEFDVTPTGSRVYLTYVFGSEDYPTRSANFSDVFGIYVTNGTGATANCATTPDGHPVSSTTVNASARSMLYRDNSFATVPERPIDVEVDGLTVEMVCSAPVTPGVPNHVKVVIADAGDQVVDSVVVLKAGSLAVSPPEACNDGVDNNGDGRVDFGVGAALADPLCIASTTAAPLGASGIGSAFTAPAFTGYAGRSILLDDNVFGVDPAQFDPASPPDAFAWSVLRKGAAGKCTVTPATAQPLNGTLLPTATALCQAPGTYTADLLATRNNSTVGHWYTDFTVMNAPPSLVIATPTDDQYFDLGATVTVSAPITDVDGEAVSCRVNWGTDAYWYSATLVGGACTAQHVYTSPSRYPVSVIASDASGQTSGNSQVVSVGKLDQAITVTVEPPAYAPKLTSFTVQATGGASEEPLVFGSDGGCTNIDNVYTMISATTDCEVLIDQGGTAATTPQYYPAATVVYSVSAGPATPTAVTLPVSVRRGRPFIVPRSTVQGAATQVEVTGRCRVARVFIRRSNGVRFRWYAITGTRRGSCTVTVTADAVGDYSPLLQTSTVRIR